MAFVCRGPMKSILFGLIFAGTASLLGSEARAAEAPAHVAWGEILVATLLPSKNEYGSTPSYIRWEGDIGYTAAENRTVCGTFVTLLFQRAYGLKSSDFSAWMGTASPDAAVYHDAIAAEDGFENIAGVSDIETGDIIAIKYPPGSSCTGHVAIVADLPVEIPMAAPILNGARQFEVVILDSTSTPHGSSDSRVKADGSFDAGAGSGSMRLYAGPKGKIVGYTWSTESSAIFYDQGARHLVVGRLAL